MIEFENFIPLGIASVNEAEMLVAVSFSASNSLDALKAESKILTQKLFC